MAFKAPFFRYEDLRRCAEAFLLEHHPGREIPVPIERIVDIQFGIDIVPMPGLGNFDTVAYLSHNLTEIRVQRVCIQPSAQPLSIQFGSRAWPPRTSCRCVRTIPVLGRGDFQARHDERDSPGSV